MANRLGLEIAINRKVRVLWDGSEGYDCIKTNPQWIDCVSNFGSGVISFSIPYLFSTPRGWSLWVGGPSNDPMDGVAPLEGIVETGWTPFTFTMNWRMTMIDEWATFHAGQAIARVFPIRIAPIKELEFNLRGKDALPKRKRADYERWYEERADFQEKLKRQDPSLIGQERPHRYANGAKHSRLAVKV